MMKLWNNSKTTVLMAGLMGLCLVISYAVGGQQVLVTAFLIGAMMNLSAFLFSDKIAPAAVRARPVSHAGDPVLWDLVEALAERAHFPIPAVYLSPASAPNVLATGRGPRYRAASDWARHGKALYDPPAHAGKDPSPDGNVTWN